MTSLSEYFYKQLGFLFDDYRLHTVLCGLAARDGCVMKLEDVPTYCTLAVQHGALDSFMTLRYSISALSGRMEW